MSQWTTLTVPSTPSSAYSDLPPSDIDNDQEEQLIDDAFASFASYNSSPTLPRSQALSKRSHTPTSSATQERPQKRRKASEETILQKVSSTQVSSQPPSKGNCSITPPPTTTLVHSSPSPGPSKPSPLQITRHSPSSSESDSDGDLPSVEMLLAPRKTMSRNHATQLHEKRPFQIIPRTHYDSDKGDSSVLELTSSESGGSIKKSKANTSADTDSIIELTDDEPEEISPLQRHPSPLFIDLTVDSDEDDTPARLVTSAPPAMLPTPTTEKSDDKLHLPDPTIPSMSPLLGGIVAKTGIGSVPSSNSGRKTSPCSTERTDDGTATLPTPPNSSRSSEDLHVVIQSPYVLSIRRWFARAYPLHPATISNSAQCAGTEM